MFVMFWEVQNMNKQMKTLFEKFEVLEVLRDIRGKKYKLIDILIMTTIY